ncbi:ArsR family transcriptional regulator [Methylobacterium sp. Leaf123]|uniref:ArsR/SmtB family transcription factor n=1 Tax=Methylobacterium sp. Leaf123 TaxID=1736264 RepID=UPI0006F7D649|nr:metalloregulator ArsR/SmtB family transcription factor [Methylobacterium sp. Leaf123]KQQ14208.1 ArsR family transcriptional regulator [Methylobacterium sp. Leaf123]
MNPTESLPEDRAREVSDLLKVFAHPGRLRLLSRLSEGECSVAEMERELGIRQPSLSQHLGELREAELVSTRREHKTVFYTLTAPRALELVEILHAMFGSDEPQSRPLRRKASGRNRNGGAALFAQAGAAATGRSPDLPEPTTR